MALPIMNSDSQEMSMMQTRWAAVLDPVVANPIVQGSLIRNVALTTGTNEVNHKLGRRLQGWIIVRQRGPASVYDNQDSNSTMQALTLTLVSSAAVIVDLYVF